MTRKWVPLASMRAVLFLVSLCLNVLMGSYIAIQWLSVWPPSVTTTPPRLIQIIARRLPSADAETLWRVYSGKEQALRSSQADYDQALRGAVRLLAQTNLDVSALRRAVTDARDKRIKVGDLVIDVFLDTAPQLSSKGRQDLAGGLPDR
jgi:uncharacterized membrane protein